MQKSAALAHKNKQVLLWSVMGIDPAHDEAVATTSWKKATFFQKKYDALLETSFAHGLHVGVGDEVRLATMRGGLQREHSKRSRSPACFRLAGPRRFQPGGGIDLPAAETAERLFSKVGNVNPISIVLDEAPTKRAVAETFAQDPAHRA